MKVVLFSWIIFFLNIHKRSRLSSGISNVIYSWSSPIGSNIVNQGKDSSNCGSRLGSPGRKIFCVKIFFPRQEIVKAGDLKLVWDEKSWSQFNKHWQACKLFKVRLTSWLGFVILEYLEYTWNITWDIINRQLKCHYSRTAQNHSLHPCNVS